MVEPTRLSLTYQAILCFVIAACVVLSYEAAGAAISEHPAPPVVTQAAIWHPPAGFLARFHCHCDGRRGADFDACFARAMAAAGAQPAALAFTRRLDNQGYLMALVATGGPISVAHVFYPFRANENDAWLLVNGTPPLIDVDNRQYLDLDRLRSSPDYQVIRRRYPNVDFWPGDRSLGGPQMVAGGREIAVGYALRDLCHACAIVGHVRFAFDFAADGKFLGTRLLAVTSGGS
jgi:hypothetical protein